MFITLKRLNVWLHIKQKLLKLIVFQIWPLLNTPVSSLTVSHSLKIFVLSNVPGKALSFIDPPPDS